MDTHGPTPATLRRCLEYIDAHAAEDIGIDDIARHAHVTSRAVQLAFRAHLGTTPTAYLRGVRLERAHRELLAARPGDAVTVTAVASRWGFPSASRFAAYYRSAYGVSPRESLVGEQPAAEGSAAPPSR